MHSVITNSSPRCVSALWRLFTTCSPPYFTASRDLTVVSRRLSERLNSSSYHSALHKRARRARSQLFNWIFFWWVVWVLHLKHGELCKKLDCFWEKLKLLRYLNWTVRKLYFVKLVQLIPSTEFTLCYVCTID